jgi:phosphoribosylaminoimidazole (AIR) synthetase
MVLVVSAKEADSVTAALEADGESVHRIGIIEAGERGCTVSGSAGRWFAMDDWKASHRG